VFYKCTSLSSISFEGTNPPDCGVDIFENTLVDVVVATNTSYPKDSEFCEMDVVYITSGAPTAALSLLLALCILFFL